MKRPPSGVGCFVVGLPLVLGGGYFVWQLGQVLGAAAVVVGGGAVALGVGLRRARMLDATSYVLDFRAAGGVLGAAVLVAAALLVRRELQVRAWAEEYARQEANAAPFKETCREGIGDPRAAPYVKPGPHPMLFFTQITEGGGVFDQTHEEWRPPSIEATQLVACAEWSKVSLETCKYEGKSYHSVERTQYTLSVQVREAKTGKVVAAKQVEGAEPPPCPDVKAFGFGKDPNVSGGMPSEKAPETLEFLRAAHRG